MPVLDPAATLEALESAGVGLWSYDPAVATICLSRCAQEHLAIEGRDGEPLALERFASAFEELSTASVLGFFGAAGSGAGHDQQTAQARPPSLRLRTRRGTWLQIAFAGHGSRGPHGVGLGDGERLSSRARVFGTLMPVYQERFAEDAPALSNSTGSERTRVDVSVARLFSEFASDYVYEADFREGMPLVPNVVAGSFERTTGYTIDDVARLGGWFAIMHPEDRARAVELSKELAPGKLLIHEYRIVDSRGAVRWLRDRISVVGDPETGEATGVMGGVTDITEQRELAEQLVHAQKMESLARLAGGVAHDFNNLLTIVLGEVAHLRAGEQGDTTAGPDPSRIESYEAIREAIRRATELTRALLSFGRRTVGERRVLSLRSALMACKPLLHRAVGDSVGLQFRLDGVPDVRICMDLGELQLVLLNLAVNARDAMPQGGTLGIHAVEVQYTSSDPSRPAQVSEGNYVQLLVRDTGAGMPEAVLAQALEPYFTTKDPGRGTGLGLATASGLVARAGGTLMLASTVDVGTTVTIYLPTTQEPVDASVRPPTRVARGGSEHVLIVEDEPALRQIMVRSLRAIGYRVTDVPHAEAAMELGCTVLSTFDLVVTDVRLPGRDGLWLVDQLRVHRPTIRVLVTSGEVDEATALRLESEIFPYLPKPFAPEVLVAHCEDVLSRARAAASGPNHAATVS